jgi:hypothetical protein
MCTAGLLEAGSHTNAAVNEKDVRPRNELRWNLPTPLLKDFPAGLTSTLPHIRSFLDCVKSRQRPNATVEIGHQAVRALHLANIAGSKKARAVLAEDGTTITV